MFNAYRNIICDFLPIPIPTKCLTCLLISCVNNKTNREIVYLASLSSSRLINVLLENTSLLQRERETKRDRACAVVLTSFYELGTSPRLLNFFAGICAGFVSMKNSRYLIIFESNFQIAHKLRKAEQLIIRREKA